jgi:uncharacterized protein
MKIVIDTNLYISALIGKSVQHQLQHILQNPEILIITSAVLFEELEDKIQNEKFRKYFHEPLALNFISFLKIRSTPVYSTSVTSICRDTKDNYLLSLAKDAGANFLLTGDKDLLVLLTFETTTICTLSDFINNHRIKLRK